MEETSKNKINFFLQNILIVSVESELNAWKDFVEVVNFVIVNKFKCNFQLDCGIERNIYEIEMQPDFENTLVNVVQQLVKDLLQFYRLININRDKIFSSESLAKFLLKFIQQRHCRLCSLRFINRSKQGFYNKTFIHKNENMYN